MKKFARNIFLAASLLVVLSSCEDRMRELNTNPDMQETTKPEFIFASATQNFLNSERRHLVGKYGQSMRYMQYMTPADGNNPQGSFPNVMEATSGSPDMQYYGDYFGWRGRDLRRLIQEIDRLPDAATKQAYADLRSVSILLEVYHAWLVGDLYGAMPYHEAFRSTIDGNVTPKYDNLKQLYKQWDALVAEQIQVLEATEDAKQIKFKEYDFFYQGDTKKWAKFANTLRVKMAQRFEQVDAAHYQQVLNQVEASASGVMVTLEDGCLYRHSSTHNNVTHDLDNILRSYAASYAYVEFLKQTGDPRLPIVIRPNNLGDHSKNYKKVMASAHADALKQHPYFGQPYIGMYATPEAYLSAGANSGTTPFKGKYIRLMNGSIRGVESFRSGEMESDKTDLQFASGIQGRLFVKNGGLQTDSDPLGYNNEEWKDGNGIKMQTPVISFPEASFMFAEIAEKRGGTFAGKDAATWYEEGVRASMNWYQKRAEETSIPGAYGADISNKITAAKISDYLAGQAAYTGSKEQKLAKIYSQAWVHMLAQPDEAWAMWKRTGYPKWNQGGDDIVITNGIALLERLKNGGATYTLPRRIALPMSQTNTANWNAAQQELLQDPGYGQIGDAKGRIFWDVNPHK